MLNQHALLANAVNEADRSAREKALAILAAGINAVDPSVAVRTFVHVEDENLKVGSLSFNLTKIRRILVVGAGKASGLMAQAVEEILGDRVEGGLINVLHGTVSSFRTKRIKMNGAGHPLPDEAGREGARAILEIARSAGGGDLLLCLISGGGSALMPLPVEGVPLADKQALTTQLLKCGANIEEVNAVRKHISQLKGGQLARAAFPATVVSLILSDVVGDPLGSIASGPTSPDPTTFQDAVEVLRRYGVWGKAPSSIRAYLERGLRGEAPETPKPGDPFLSRVHNVIIGNNRLAAEAALMEARRHGLNGLLLSSLVEGEARHVGSVYAGIACEVAASGHPVSRPAAIVAGGETTVTVTGSGRGGRNQEVALAAALKIRGSSGVVVASLGTDGLDGPTDAAGALVDGQTVDRAREARLDPLRALAENDSYTFFKALGDLVFTGPTMTNVNDLAVMVVL
ncbi:MAG: glycerate kinase [Candidatus Bathyarchaeia archaeon]